MLLVQENPGVWVLFRKRHHFKGCRAEFGPGPALAEGDWSIGRRPSAKMVFRVGNILKKGIPL